MWPQVILAVGICHAKSHPRAEWNRPCVPYKGNRYFISYTETHFTVLLKTYKKKKPGVWSPFHTLVVTPCFSVLNFNIHVHILVLLRMGVAGVLLTTKAVLKVHSELGVGNLTILDPGWHQQPTFQAKSYSLWYLITSYFCFQTSHNLIDKGINAMWANKWNDFANFRVMLTGKITSLGSVVW